MAERLSLWLIFVYSITKTRLFKYIENFTTKNWKFSDKNSDILHISAQNIDCGYSLEPPRRGGSNEFPQSMFLSRNKKINVYPCEPCFTIHKRGLRGSKVHSLFSWCLSRAGWYVNTKLVSFFQRSESCLGLDFLVCKMISHFLCSQRDWSDDK